jgi:hypothetical protein
LQPREWRDRLPFFAKELPDGSVEVRCDRQEVMDREIEFAKQGGLDYWAFDYYHPKCQPGRKFMTRCLDLYRASEKRAAINYCLILLAGGDAASGDCHFGPKDEWPATCDALVQWFKEPNYQKVLGNRPLVYFFETENWIPIWGSPDAGRAAWNLLRNRAIAEGLGSPYVAGMVFDTRTGVKLVDRLGLDAISAYANPGGNDNKEKPYAALAEVNRRFWNACAATGKHFIPTVNAGWDYRPEKNHGFPYRSADADWFTPPSPQELAAHLDSAIQWTQQHLAVDNANAIIIYAWNEFNEGGWLVPTLKEGNARLEAMGKLLRPDAKTAP